MALALCSVGSLSVRPTLSRYSSDVRLSVFRAGSVVIYLTLRDKSRSRPSSSRKHCSLLNCTAPLDLTTCGMYMKVEEAMKLINKFGWNGMDGMDGWIVLVFYPRIQAPCQRTSWAHTSYSLLIETGSGASPLLPCDC
jgi:hypothetical protein